MSRWPYWHHLSYPRGLCPDECQPGCRRCAGTWRTGVALDSGAAPETGDGWRVSRSRRRTPLTLHRHIDDAVPALDGPAARETSWLQAKVQEPLTRRRVQLATPRS